MKKIAIVLLGLFLLLSVQAEAQCKFKKFPKSYLKTFRTEDCTVKPETATEMKKTLYGFSTAAVVSFVTMGENYYMYFYITRSNSSKFSMHKNNSLEFFFDNGTHVALYPCGNFDSKSLPLLDCNIGAFYSVNKEQLRQIADNGRVKSFILHVSAEKDIPSAQHDEDGSMFFEYDISSDRIGNNLAEIAACMLTK